MLSNIQVLLERLYKYPFTQPCLKGSPRNNSPQEEPLPNLGFPLCPPSECHH